MFPNSLLNDTKEGASAAAAGSLFHTGMALGKWLNLKQSIDVGYCWNLKECAALVFLLAEIKYLRCGMAVRSCAIL